MRGVVVWCVVVVCVVRSTRGVAGVLAACMCWCVGQEVHKIMCCELWVAARQRQCLQSRG